MIRKENKMDHFRCLTGYSGNTAQLAAHALLENYSVSLMYSLTKNLAMQSAYLNHAVLP